MDAVDQPPYTCLAQAAAHELDVHQVVVVAEDCHAAVPRPQGAQSLREPPRVEPLGRVAGEVSRYCDEVWSLVVDLLDQLAQALRPGPVVEVEVADLHHAVAVELGREPRQGERNGFDLDPTGFDHPRIDEASRSQKPRRPCRLTAGGISQEPSHLRHTSPNSRPQILSSASRIGVSPARISKVLSSASLS